MIQRGKRLAVCTMGAKGAIAHDADARVYRVPVVPNVRVADANGAGDAFFAGVLFGELEGVPLGRALRYCAVAAAMAVTSTELASEELDAEELRARTI